MGVDIDKPWRHVTTRCINCLLRFSKVMTDRSYLVTHNCHVSRKRVATSAINNRAPFYEYVVHNPALLFPFRFRLLTRTVSP
jgi:hypothetical protein